MPDAWFYQPHGGPHSIADLQAKFPQIDSAALEVRRACIASPIYLAATLLSCMWKQNLFDRPSEAHRLVEQAMIAQTDTLYVDARGTAKTTLLDEVGTVWQLLKYPNDSVLLTHSSATNAKGLSHSVRVHFVLNKRLCGIFPEYEMPQIEAGNILAWSVPCRELGGREDSVECATPGTATAGRHYDVVKSSDWMNEQTTPLYGLGSIEVMNGLVALFSQVRAMLQAREVNPRAHYTIDSNRWHDGDLPGTIIRRDKDANVVRKIVRGVTGSPGSFVSSWPEVKKPEDIQRIYDDPTMTAAAFAANYRSDPLPDGGYAFNERWLHEYGKGTHCVWCNENHPEPESFRVGILLDPAFSDSKTDAKKTDRSGLVVVGVSPQRRIHVLYSAAGRGWDETEICRRLFNAMDVYGGHEEDKKRFTSQYVGIEDTSGAKSIIRIFNNEALMTGRHVNYRKIAPGGKSKSARIAPLHHIAQEWGIFVRRSEHKELCEELIRFGVAEHDDLADALAYAADDVWAATPEAPLVKVKLTMVPPPPPYTEADVRREIAEARRRRTGKSSLRRVG